MPQNDNQPPRLCPSIPAHLSSLPAFPQGEILPHPAREGREMRLTACAWLAVTISGSLHTPAAVSLSITHFAVQRTRAAEEEASFLLAREVRGWEEFTSLR